MTRPVSSPRQMALRQTLQRNVFRKPVEGGPKGPVPEEGRGREPGTPPEDPADPLPDATPPAGAPAGPRVGRNDPCPCGSGKKFKKCCG